MSVGHSHNLLKVETFTDELGVHQIRDVLGTVTYHYIVLCNSQMEESIKKRLIELGWTPPAE